MYSYSIEDSAIDVVGALGIDQDSEGWVTPRRLPDWTRNQFADAGMERYVRSAFEIHFKY